MLPALSRFRVSVPTSAKACIHAIRSPRHDRVAAVTRCNSFRSGPQTSWPERQAPKYVRLSLLSLDYKVALYLLRERAIAAGGSDDSTAKCLDPGLAEPVVLPTRQRPRYLGLDQFAVTPPGDHVSHDRYRLPAGRMTRCPVTRTGAPPARQAAARSRSTASAR